VERIGQTNASGGEDRAVPIIRAAGIGKRFDETQVLKDVDLELSPGEVLALTGENGAGKSTLMKILAGIYADYEGQIVFDGQVVAFASVLDAERLGIAIIHQDLNLVPELTVSENIFLGREPLRFGAVLDRARTRKGAADLLKRIGLAIDPDAKVGTLRVGEQQLVEIAKAISIGARVLIMDEPTSALSPGECERLFSVVRQLSAEGVAIIYISHRMDEVMDLANRVMVLRDGRRVLTAPIGELTRERIITAMVGRGLFARKHEPAARAGNAILTVRNLTLDVPTRQGMRRAVDNVSFDVRAGEILGIGGLLGAGRTEILEAIFGAARGEWTGSIMIDGKEASISDPSDAKALGIAFVPEDRKTRGLILGSSILTNVVLPSLASIARFSLLRFRREEDISRRQVHDLALHYSHLRQPAATLSGGNQQKVVLAKWLATRPRILLLDEPTRGIDVGAKQEIHELIFALANQGIAIVVVSSELPELMYLSDRILVMCEGKATGLLSRTEASEERIMKLAALPSRRDATVKPVKA
jgi:ribose transport system ATP-binding protein